MRSVAPTAQRREPQPTRPHRRAGEGEHGVDADRAQQRALARHVRAADERARAARRRAQTSLRTQSARGSADGRALGVEAGLVLVDLGERVGGVLVGVGGQRAERLELADRREPAGDLGPGAHPPGVDRQGELGRPQQERRERGEELVVLASSRCRSRASRAIRRDAGSPSVSERLPEPGQRPATGTTRARAGASSSASTQGRASGARSRRERGGPAPSTGSRTRSRRRSTEKSGSVPRSVAAQRPATPDREHGEHGGDDRRDPRPEKTAGSLPQAASASGVDPLADVGAEQLQVLAQVEPRSQLVDGLLTRADRRRARPARAARPPASPRPRASARCRAARRASPCRRGRGRPRTGVRRPGTARP